MFGKLFNNLKNGLTKTKNVLTDKINETLKLAITIDEDLYEELEEILAVIGKYSEDNNATINAIRDGFNEEKIKQIWNVEKIVPFSSQKKWSGVEFKDKGSYIIGATEFILKEKADEYQEEINEYANNTLARVITTYKLSYSKRILFKIQTVSLAIR